MQQHLINIKQTALHQLPTHTFAYLPREGNAIADHLAGVGAEMLPRGNGVDIHSHTPLPASLLNKVEMYHLPQEQSLTLHERPHIHHPPLAAYWQQHPAHRQDLVRYLAKHKAHATVNGLQMTYWRTSGDGKGRFYAQGPAAQRLPKELRILLFGRTHIEIDIIGAFYEIIRRTASRLKETGDSSTLPVLPAIEQAWQHVEHELLHQWPQSHAAPVAKRLLHIAINASVTITAKFVTDSQYTFTPFFCLVRLSQLIAVGHN